jgi:hypothetical protein
MSIPSTSPNFDPNSSEELDRLIGVVWDDKDLRARVPPEISIDDLNVRLRKRFTDSPIVIPAEAYRRIADGQEREARASAELLAVYDSEPTFVQVPSFRSTLVLGSLLVAIIVEALSLTSKSLSFTLWGWAVPSWLASAVAFTVTVGVVVYSQYLRLHGQWDRRLEQSIQTRGAAERLLSEAKENARGSLAISVVRPALLEILSDVSRDRYDGTLAGTTFDGLSQAFEAKEELPTEEQALLKNIVSNTRGGSIGISGPRGAGKTTLLGHWCNPSRRFSRDKPTLAALLSAPVDYDSRDFLLFLLYTLCRAGGRSSGSSFAATSQSITADETSGAEIWTPWWFSRLGPLLALNGFTLSVGAVVATRLGHGWDWIGDPLLDLGVSPARCFWIGLGMTALGLLGGRGLEALRRGAGFPGSVGSIGDEADVFELIEDAQVRLAEKVDKQVSPESRAQQVARIIGDLCYRILLEIKFQQSFSAGWSGTLSLPVGLEGGIERSKELAKRQLSLPEVVDAHRQLATLLAKHYVIVLGIDELDKLESPQAAASLLNDLKLLFDIEGCYYFVTVSESALASFDSRGLRIRDVMDSSFDTVLRLGYLSLQNSRALLARRAISLPFPFVALCHALSGGLPRDLIRVCRLVAEAQAENMLALPDVTMSVLRADLVARSRAFAFAARQAGLAENLDRGVPKLPEAPTPEQWDRELTARSRLIAAWSSELRRQAGRGRELENGLATMGAASAAFAAYTYFVATLGAAFSAERDEAKWKELIQTTNVFDLLGTARQLMADLPSAAVCMIIEARKLLGLEEGLRPPLFNGDQKGDASVSNRKVRGERGSSTVAIGIVRATPDPTPTATASHAAQSRRGRSRPSDTPAA